MRCNDWRLLEFAVQNDSLHAVLSHDMQLSVHLYPLAYGSNNSSTPSCNRSIVLHSSTLAAM